MNLTKLLQRAADDMESRLETLRMAISTLNGGGGGNGRKKRSNKGRPLSAAHKAAIKAGWAKRRKLHAA